ncbi:molybdate ABC transporter substrate-binding protein [Leucobacter sp. Z1108]|uniref:molybdate ABC transporter substrate-binding protein n=1 Tax=unclassified Leucobacter TaxID=2621730 RepID=UPI003D97BCC1
MKRTAGVQVFARLGPLTLILGALLPLSACSASSSETGPTSLPSASSSTQESTVQGEITVYAAASLTAAFNVLTTEFMESHPGVTFTPTVFDGSSTLATQIVAGAPADIFASADERTMSTVADAGLVAHGPSLFATNELVIAVAPENPLGIDSLADLSDTESGAPLVVLCAAEVPCGNASRSLLRRANVSVTPVSEEQSVSAVLSKVRNLEADAGLVYRTDVLSAAGEVEGITIAGAENNLNHYQIGVVQGAASSEAALAFTAFVLSADGKRILAEFGFGTP